MKETLEAYFPELLKHEGGYVDHPSDPGGATKYGITIGTLAKHRGKAVSKLDVRNLTKDEAREIYRRNYWDAIKADGLPAGVDALAFDIAVNHGVGRWRQWKPLIDGLSPADAVRAVTERRRRFYRSLKPFPTFGKGWMRRANAVEAWALLWAESKAGDVVSSVKPKTLATSKTAWTAGGVAATATGSIAAVNSAVDGVNDAKDTVSKLIEIAKPLVLSPYFPWVAGALILAGCAFIVYDRRRKLRVFGF